MADTISVAEYLAREETQLASWATRPLMQLEIAMDYSGPWREPDYAGVVGSLALRWTQLYGSESEEFRLKALLGAFLYAKTLNVDVANRSGLFGRVQEALRRGAYITGKSRSVTQFAKWNLQLARNARQVVWPWNIVVFDDLTSEAESAIVDVDNVRVSALKIYRATLLEGPLTPSAPDGFWLQLSIPDAHFQRVMLPAATLGTLSYLLAEASEAEQPELIKMLSGINAYHKTAHEVQVGHEAIAVGAAIKAMQTNSANVVKDPAPPTVQSETRHPADVLEGRLKDWLNTMNLSDHKQLARRIAVGLGVLLVAVNVLPSTTLRGSFFWSESSRLLFGLGMALVVIALLTKPKDEPL